MLCEWLSPDNNMQETPQLPALQDAAGTVFLSQDPKPLPHFPESKEDCYSRYRAALDELADQYWPKTLLLVTHQGCVQEAVGWGGKKDDVEAVYCAHVELSRTGKQSRDWTWRGDKGIFKYDVVF
jgi:broad specificity phosphatase PhoE